ncbi:hypothetical protein [Persicobacter psychrovividus]|uniref:Ligand-binding SRPBCC domain-containing protein n=1 Tax=Persicobacter psychrovividus TaxID=387638 RepID=A0ABN6L4A9_9BACT|nr:hypothetical protein PEPS_00210 [Persicobacter psychrovividus]
MRIKISTKVGAPLDIVRNNFGEELFRALSPAFPKLTVHQYDGNKVGGKVAVELDFFAFKEQWVSEITEVREGDFLYYFKDKGRKLPFFLSTWEHRHIVEAQDSEHTLITDDFNYSCGNRLFDVLCYPLLYGQFYARKKGYQQYFHHLYQRINPLL